MLASTDGEEVVPIEANDGEDVQGELEILRAQVRTLEDEVDGLVRRLQDAPKRVRTLEERLLETKGQLAQAVSQNEKLAGGGAILYVALAAVAITAIILLSSDDSDKLPASP